MMLSTTQAAKSTVKALEIRPTDSTLTIARRMVLKASVGQRVTLSPEGTPNFCRFFLAYNEAKCVFWGRINNRPFTAYNGETVALEIVRAWIQAQKAGDVRL